MCRGKEAVEILIEEHGISKKPDLELFAAAEACGLSGWQI